MRSYYGVFYYNNEEYVIKFKIAGSLAFSTRSRAFIDRMFYVRSVPEVICLAALDTNPQNDKSFRSAYLISWDDYDNRLSNGAKKWTPKREIINWD